MATYNQNGLDLLKKRYFLRSTDTGELIEHTPEEMFKRVASFVSKAEKTEELQNIYERQFYDVMDRQLFIPNSPTLMNAKKNKCLSACSVLGRIPDSLEDIYKYIWYNAKLTKYGAGVGQDLSDIRPKGEIIKSSGGKSAGATNWMKSIQAIAVTTIQGDTARRSANMVSLRFNHPDIEDFISIKKGNDNYSAMNISVIIKDSEFEKVLNHEEMYLEWNGKNYRKVNAGGLFDKIVSNAWADGEPGIIFIDKVNKDNPFNTDIYTFDETNEHYMITTNPCGEQPLESYELCNLGSINLEKMYDDTAKDINYLLLKETIKTAVRFLDNIIDINEYVLPEFEKKVKGNRKIGLGVMGFAHLLIKMGIRYDSDETLKIIDTLFGFIKNVAEKYDAELAEEKGVFPNWKDSIYARMNMLRRNATITTQAPTGSISTIGGTESYGIEPIFNVGYTRRIVDGEIFEVNHLFEDMLHKEVNDFNKEQYILKQCCDKGTVELDCVPKKLKNLFRCANDISYDWHIKIMARLQNYYHNAISKTINFPENATLSDVKNAYKLAFELGCKGITVYRNNSRDMQTIQIGNKENKSKLDYLKPISRSTIGKTHGTTVFKRSACGKMYITINRDSEGNLIESFVNVGKTGVCKSCVDGINRMVSLSLRSGIMVEKIVDQLKGIVCPACTKVTGQGEKKIDGVSCPDIIAKTLEEEYKEGKKIQDNMDIINTKDSSKCPCCGAVLNLTEGCMSCISCGWSKC